MLKEHEKASDRVHETQVSLPALQPIIWNERRIEVTGLVHECFACIDCMSLSERQKDR